MHFIDFCFQKLFSVKILPSAKNYWKKNYLMFNYIISKAICHIHHKHQIPRKDRAKILLDQTYDQQALTWLLHCAFLVALLLIVRQLTPPPLKTLYMGDGITMFPLLFQIPCHSLSLSLPYKQPSSPSRICVIRNSVIEGQSLEREGRKKKGLRIIMI